MRSGWRIERIEGSHHILQSDRPDVAIVVAIRGSRTMPPKAIIATLKAARITVEEFNSEA